MSDKWSLVGRALGSQSLALMHLCPTTPRAGSVGGFVGEFCWRTPQGVGDWKSAHSVNLHANADAYIPCGHSEWSSDVENTVFTSTPTNFVWQPKQSCQLPWWHFFMWQRQRLAMFFSRIASSTCRLAGDCLF